MSVGCRHVGQTEAGPGAADREGARQLAGVHEPGLLNIRRRTAAGRTAQRAQDFERVDAGVVHYRILSSPACTCTLSRYRPICVPRYLKCRQIVYELEGFC